MADIKTGKSLKLMLISKFYEEFGKSNGTHLVEQLDMRQKAIRYFEEIGFPTMKNEFWKYTNLAFIDKLNFGLDSAEVEDLPEGLIEKVTYDSSEADLAVIINGKFSERYSHIGGSENVEIKSLSRAFAENADDISEHYAKILTYEDNPFAAINTALSTDGVFIKVARGHVQDKPLHILLINDVRRQPEMSNPRKLIIAGESSEFSIIESSIKIGENRSLLNEASEITMAPNSKVNYYKVQDETELCYVVTSAKAKVATDAVFNKATITLGGKFVRNNLSTEFTGRNAESNYYGLFIVNDDNLVDNHTFVDHALPDCRSNEDYKGIMNDKGIGIFNGKILVRPDAQNTNAYQSNKNILLSDLATINTKPELEIYADDVKCSHGATSGSIDRDMLFYLRSRGIEEQTALGMLLNSFASEIVDQIRYEKAHDLIAEKVAIKLDIH